MQELPIELQLRILSLLIESSHNWEKAIQLLYNGMLINSQSLDLCQDRKLWQMIAIKFNDYARLYKRYKITTADWKVLVRERLSDVIIQRIILVGDRTTPENKYLVRVNGNGTMYIGSVISESQVELIKYFSNNDDDLDIYRYEDTYYMMIAYYLDVIGQSTCKVVDISNYDPFMLVLTETGDCIEFIFKPSWDTKWTSFTKPRLMVFPNNTKVDKIYTMDYAFMAISDGFIWAWTVVDHPIPGSNTNSIRTKPVLLEKLSAYYCYYVEPKGNITRLYYLDRININSESILLYKSPFKDDIVDPKAQFVDVDNYDVMAVITQDIFSEDDVTTINDLLINIEF